MHTTIFCQYIFSFSYIHSCTPSSLKSLGNKIKTCQVTKLQITCDLQKGFQIGHFISRDILFFKRKYSCILQLMASQNLWKSCSHPKIAFLIVNGTKSVKRLCGHLPLRSQTFSTIGYENSISNFNFFCPIVVCFPARACSL